MTDASATPASPDTDTGTDNGTHADAAPAAPPSDSQFGVREIMDWLPHRYPFQLVDRVLAHVPKSHIVAVKNVTANEPYFQGHFPGLPTMPGVLMLEAMAQAAGIMVVRESGTSYRDGTMLYFAGIDAARFKRLVVPGDTLTIEARLVKWRKPLFRFSVTARVGNEVACEADLTAVARTGT